MFSNNSGMGGGGSGGFDFSDMFGGLGNIFSGMFGNSGGPYKDASKEYEKWMQYAQGSQMPFFNAGVGGMGNYQNWLQGMQDPSKFINNLMGGYQESPHAKNLQNEAMRAGQNMGSASGLSGSTPLMQQMQQNAGNISSADQNQWLQSVLGVNNQYGQGQQNLMNSGQNAANMLSQLWGQQAGDMSKFKYNQSRGNQLDWGKILGGLGGLAGLFF
jgi:hypothetical protein